MNIGISIGLRGTRPRILKTANFSADPGGSGAFALPSWLSLSCATVNRTSQTSASTIRTGFGANAARARSMDGALWGLNMESARAVHGGALAGWSTSGTITVTSDVDPSGAATVCAVNDNDAANAAFLVKTLSVVSGNRYVLSAWEKVIGPITSTARLDGNYTAGTVRIDRTQADVAWVRRDVSDVSTVTNCNAVIQPRTTAGDTGSVFVYAYQIELGKYPSSAFIPPSETTTRAADVLSIPSPAGISPNGFLDVDLTWVPHYAHTEQSADHDLLFFDSNNRLFLQQSTAQLVLRIGGADVLSSALTWSRNQAIRVRAQHRSAGRALVVSGATSGNGTAAGSSSSALSLPATAYLLGNASGSQECGDLRSITFFQAA